MAKNRAVNNKPEDEDSGCAQPYKVELNLLKSAHVAFLKKVWKMYGDPILVNSMMHTVHHAMMDYEFKFLVKESEEKVSGDKRDA